MAKPLILEELPMRDGIHTCRFVIEGDVFERQWTSSGESSPVKQYFDEDSALFLALVWRLTADRMVYLVPRWWRDEACLAAGEPYALIRWEYEVSNEIADFGVIKGFVAARSSVRGFPPAGPFAREHRSLATMFEAPRFPIVLAMFRNLMIDASTDITFYAFEEYASTKRTIGTLRREEHPALSDVLVGAGDMLVQFVYGYDYRASAVVVHSRRNVAPELRALIGGYSEAIDKYEAKIESIGNQDEWEERVTDLIKVNDRSRRERDLYGGWDEDEED